jgi:ERCC4-type nuclease
MSLTGVLVDNREPQHIQALRFGGVPVAPTMLDVGDLWASCDDGQMLGVERKAPNDLLASIRDGRLFQQCAALRERFQWAYLVVTGILTDSLDGHVVTNNRTSGWRWTDVQGALLTVQELGVAVVYCAGDEQYEDTVLRLARRERQAEKVLAPRTQSRVLTPAEQILTSLPGIGLERAQRILEHFGGNPAYALAWLTWLKTVLEIDGIGDGTKHQVRRALGLEPDQWLTVFDDQSAQYAARGLRDAQQEAKPLVDVQPETSASNPAGSNGRGGADVGRNEGTVSSLQMPILR